MSQTRRDYREGSITAKRPNVWRLRYRDANGKRLSATIHGSRADAQKELRRLLKSVDDREHVAPSRLTLSAWVQEWIKLLNRGETGGRRGLVSARTSERYEELLETYVLPTIGEWPVQQITTREIDGIYIAMEERGLSPSTVRHVHVALRACLATAMRKGHLAKNPTDNVDVPRPVERDDVGTALDADDLKRLITGFAGSVYQIIIITAVMTGARLSEVLALRWTDFDPKAKTLRIERAIEVTKKYGRRLKEPKSKRGRRSIVLDDALVARLVAHRETHLRIDAGVPDGVEVDLSMVRLPAEALIFPSPVDADGFDFARLRNPKTMTREIRERLPKLGFATLRSFQDFRVSHATALLDDGKAPHTVAARVGNSPEVLMRAYAKRTRKADTSVAASLNVLADAVLK
jgi:integrase